MRVSVCVSVCDYVNSGLSMIRYTWGTGSVASSQLSLGLTIPRFARCPRTFVCVRACVVCVCVCMTRCVR